MNIKSLLTVIGGFYLAMLALDVAGFVVFHTMNSVHADIQREVTTAVIKEANR